MLRRLLLNNHSQQQPHPLLTNNITSNHSSASWCCSAIVTSCAGIFTPSSQLLTSKRISRNRRKNPVYVDSVSNWTWDFCKQFTDLVHSPSLGLPKARSMEPGMQVFAELNINESSLRNPPRDKKTGDNTAPVYAHCKIEHTMKRMGHKKVVVNGENLVTPDYSIILNDNREMVRELSNALVAEQRQDGRVGMAAFRFATLCGLDDPEHVRFKMFKSARHDFRIFGGTCHSEPDWYSIQSVNNNLLLILSDTEDEEDDQETMPFLTNLGQVVGKMLLMLSASRKEKQVRNVFGVRYSNGRVCGFRLDSPSKRQLETLIETRNVPDKKLQLLCTHQDPENCRGWSLLDKGERWQALQMMADTRAFMLKR